MWNLKKQNRKKKNKTPEKRTPTEKRLVVARGGEWVKWVTGVKR